MGWPAYLITMQTGIGAVVGLVLSLACASDFRLQAVKHEIHLTGPTVVLTRPGITKRVQETNKPWHKSSAFAPSPRRLSGHWHQIIAFTNSTGDQGCGSLELACRCSSCCLPHACTDITISIECRVRLCQINNGCDLQPLVQPQLTECAIHALM